MTKAQKRKKRDRLWRGDRVKHSHRGLGTFECYGADDSDCFVMFDDNGEWDRVTTSMVARHVGGPLVEGEEIVCDEVLRHEAKGKPLRLGWYPVKPGTLSINGRLVADYAVNYKTGIISDPRVLPGARASYISLSGVKFIKKQK